MSPGCMARDRGGGLLADAVLGERDRPPEHAGDRRGDGLERLRRVAPLRPAEMRQQDDLAALVGDLADGRRHALDAGRVGDLAVLDRHVEVDAHEHRLPFDVGLVERAEGGHGMMFRLVRITRPPFGSSHRGHVDVDEARRGRHSNRASPSDTEPPHRRDRRHVVACQRRQISLPIATAVSTMRLEKPHSLSYHDITRTSVPSMTLVWSMGNTDECGSWLKSMETLGASV